MPAARRPEPNRRRFTVTAVGIAPGAWHLTVRELPATWTVAFALEDLESRARQRIALDLDCDPEDFDVAIEPERTLYLERRANQRDASN